MTATRDEIIAYLVDRKFKRSGDAPFPSMESWLQSRKGTLEPFFSLSQDENEYEASLKKMSDLDLKGLFADINKHEAIERRAREELEDQKRFFHEPQADAEFDHWSKMARWTTDEATALSLGKAPEVVNWDKLEHISRSPFADQYAKRRNLVLRAELEGELEARILPAKFVTWAEQRRVTLPPELKKAVRAVDQNLEDWDRLRTKCQELKTKLAKLEQEKPLNTRERNTLYKIIIGMAIKKYSYKKDAKKQHAPEAIATTLRELDLTVSAETILEKLNDAAKELL
jgi:hypothetical protein